MDKHDQLTQLVAHLESRNETLRNTLTNERGRLWAMRDAMLHAMKERDQARDIARAEAEKRQLYHAKLQASMLRIGTWQLRARRWKQMAKILYDELLEIKRWDSHA